MSMQEDSVETLDALIGGFLDGSTPFEALQAGYSPVYLFLPDDAFPDVQTEVWYGVVHERIEWAAPAPTDEQRKYGWISVAELRAWLQSAVATKPRIDG